MTISDTDSNNPPVIVALDFDTSEAALALARQLDARQCRVKVGKELFTRAGPALVESLQGLGFDVFLDLKFHDIPNTVAKAVRAAADLGVWMVNVHALGGRAMMSAARDAANAVPLAQQPKLIAVTILTSLAGEDLGEIGLSGDPQENVLRLAGLANDCQLDGVVCSSQEVTALRSRLDEGFCLVTPGIRPAGSAVDDQKRITTPEQAMAMGSSYLVIGRPITQAADPLMALAEINSVIFP